jgi:hypothetical protein
VSDYRRGIVDGRRDQAILCLPVGQTPHTLAQYRRIRVTYEMAIYALQPSDYQRGYADGFDAAALAAKAVA